MRKLFLCVLMATAVVANGQIVVKDADEAPTASESKTIIANAKQNADDYNAKPVSGMIDYGVEILDGGFSMGANVGFAKYFFVGFDYRTTSAGSGKSKVDVNGWDVLAGLRYRYYPVNRLWVEGDAGVGYYHTSVTIGYGKDKQKSSAGKFGVMITPRVGLNVWEGLGAFVGYRWDAPDFKFDGAGHVYFGVSIAF